MVKKNEPLTHTFSEEELRKFGDVKGIRFKCPSCNTVNETPMVSEDNTYACKYCQAVYHGKAMDK